MTRRARFALLLALTPSALAESYSKFKIGQDDVGMSGGRVVTSVAPGNLIKVPWLQPSE
jgi:hypothetical protein